MSNSATLEKSAKEVPASNEVLANDVLVSLTNISKTYKKGKELVPVLTDINVKIQQIGRAHV